MAVTRNAYAKINLSLDVVGKRPDGYHDLRMIMQSVSLHDTLTVDKSRQPGFHLKSNAGFLPADRRNLAINAAFRFFEETGLPVCGLDITLTKRIPVAAGLAGGSTDAAAMLRALDILFGTQLGDEELCRIGKTLGADVPYCIMGGTALAEGIGELLTPQPALPGCSIVLCKPPFSISTPAVFSRINCRQIIQRPDTKGILDALSAQDLGGVARRMFNVLESVPASDHLEIGQIRCQMVDMGALGTVMSGSGPTVFGIYDDPAAAARAAAVLEMQYPDTFITSPVGAGEDIQ